MEVIYLNLIAFAQHIDLRNDFESDDNIYLFDR